MSAITTSPWASLPTEMKLAVVDILDIDDVKVLSKVDQGSYALCVPAIFRTVKLDTYHALKGFLQNVPNGYYRYIQDLNICTQCADDHDGIHSRTASVTTLLSACLGLEKLTLRLAGSLDKAVLPYFSHLTNLKQLSVSNWGEEEKMPISERLVVYMAASIPGLEQLSLDRISRSQMHAPELVGVYPYIPLVAGDSDIPAHPVLGSDLCLPSLLRIPSLRKLIIRDTHLGDRRWATTPVACHLEVLDLGSCYHENEDFNRVCTERIMAAVGPTVDEFSLTTAVSDTMFAKPSVTPLQRLRKLHITPFFPVDSVVDTITTLAGSPIERLSMQCYEDDVVDVCSALEEFLSLRVERGPEFYKKLTRIDVSVAANIDADSSSEDSSERVEAAKRLQEFCRDLRLASEFGGAPVPVPFAAEVGSCGRRLSISAVCPDDKKPVAWL